MAHNVRQTKGTFLIIGNAVGTKSDRFYKERETKTGKIEHSINLGVETNHKNVNYVILKGYDGAKAKFNKYDKESKKNLTKEVAFEDRFDFDEEGFNPMFGVRVGLEKDEKGKNISSVLFPFDACTEIYSNLNDGDGIYVEGKISFESYVNNGEKRRAKKFEIEKIYGQKEPVDFDDENFKEENKFEQELIYMGIEQEKVDNKATGRFILSAKVVTYTSVEDVEFIIEDKGLANKIKTGLKPYHMIKVMGRLVSKVLAEAKVETDAWGSDDDMKEQHDKVVKEMVITKAYPDTIDKETYSEEVLDSIVKAQDDFGTEIVVDESEEDDVWE